MRAAVDEYGLTENERAYFEFSVKFYVGNDQLPPLRIVAEKLGMASDTVPNYHRAQLRKKGFFEANDAGKIRLTEKGWNLARELIGLERPRLVRVVRAA